LDGKYPTTLLDYYSYIIDSIADGAGYNRWLFLHPLPVRHGLAMAIFLAA
jgi:hypothetical protein